MKNVVNSSFLCCTNLHGTNTRTYMHKDTDIHAQINGHTCTNWKQANAVFNIVHDRAIWIVCQYFS